MGALFLKRYVDPPFWSGEGLCNCGLIIRSQSDWQNGFVSLHACAIYGAAANNPSVIYVAGAQNEITREPLQAVNQ
jgi:hypothetical protein